jgi:hypothetical protein
MSKMSSALGSMAFSPALWGLVSTILFFAPVRSGAWDQPLLKSYFVENGWGQVVACLCLMGLATLLSRYLALAGQFRLLEAPLLDAIPPGGQPLADSDLLLSRLDNQPATVQKTYLIRRLRDVLEYVYRKNSADTVEAEMRFLAVADRESLSVRYAVPKYLTIAMVAAGIVGGLPVTAGQAFDGAPLSVALFGAVALLFAIHFCQKVELKLLAAVDARVHAEMIGRFEPSYDPGTDPQIMMLKGIGEQVTRSSEQLVTRQTELWKSAFIEAQRQWNDWSVGACKQLQQALNTSLSTTMQAHAATVAASTEQQVSRWSEIQQALLQNAEAVTLQQQELVRQGEVLTQVIAATGQVEKLESELNRNLSTLAGAKNFEQTVLSLGAAIQLLNSKLGAVPTPETPKVELKSKRKAA